MLINFALLPLDQIQPWGSPGNLSLSWFGLTDGQYWIQAGESTLFEYNDHAQAAGVPRYCDYQVVRLYEDLTEMLPHILEPVPPSLVRYISGETWSEWQETYTFWYKQNNECQDQEKFWDNMDSSYTWVRRRLLDSAYLSPSANIAIWSDATNVYFEWDNRTKFFNGLPAWTALRGMYKLPHDDFVKEILSFHSRLIEQMAHRVDQVLSGILSPEINIDLTNLVKEQEQRSHTLDRMLSSTVQTDWQAVEKAINEILIARSDPPV